MRKILYILLFVLLLSTPVANATTRYVNTACDNGDTDYDGATQTCDAGSDTVYNSIANALSAAQNGETVSIANGNYGISDSLTVPEGVSITATSQDSECGTLGNCNVRIYPTGDQRNRTNPMLLLSSAAGHDGDQSISYIELDGVDGSYEFGLGILVDERDNVDIHHNYIHDFVNILWHGGAINATAHTDFINNGSGYWQDYWPEDVQVPGTDTNLDAGATYGWPTNPIDDLQIYNNYIKNCGYYYADNSTGGAAIEIGNIANSSIHDNICDNSDYGMECIAGIGNPVGGAGKEAFLNNVDIYSNTLTHGFGDKTVGECWVIEMWVMRGGCEIYDNTSDGFLSITYGKETKVYDNIVDADLDAPNDDGGYGVEFNNQSYSTVERNYFEGTYSGVVTGSAYTKNYITRHTLVRNNIIYNHSYRGIFIHCIGRDTGSYNTVVTNQYLYNNVIIGTDTRGYWGILVTEQSPASTCDLDYVYIKNNISRDNTTYAGRSTTNNIATISIDYNGWYSNGTDDWQNGNDTHSVTTDPQHANPGSGTPATWESDYTLSSEDYIDGGGWLTTINVSDGSGSTITVENVGYFRVDDTIRLENGDVGVVESINYSAKSLGLDRSVSWENGDGVSMNYGGTAPDIGAVETDLGSSPPVVSITATDSSGAENPSDDFAFTFACSPACAGETINFTYSGSAAYTSDYTCANGEDVSDGDIAITGETDVITCTPVDDSDEENVETVTVTVNSGTGYTVGSPSSGNATITSDETPQDQGIGGITVDASGNGSITYSSSGSGSWSR